jgi:hypothetical protein
MPREVGKPEVL